MYFAAYLMLIISKCCSQSTNIFSARTMETADKNSTSTNTSATTVYYYGDDRGEFNWKSGYYYNPQIFQSYVGAVEVVCYAKNAGETIRAETLVEIAAVQKEANFTVMFTYFCNYIGIMEHFKFTIENLIVYQLHGCIIKVLNWQKRAYIPANDNVLYHEMRNCISNETITQKLRDVQQQRRECLYGQICAVYIESNNTSTFNGLKKFSIGDILKALNISGHHLKSNDISEALKPYVTKLMSNPES